MSVVSPGHMLLLEHCAETGGETPAPTVIEVDAQFVFPQIPSALT